MYATIERSSLSMTKLTHPDEHHPHKIIIHSGLWYLATYSNEAQLDAFCSLTGAEFTLIEEKPYFYGEGTFAYYKCNLQYEETIYGFYAGWTPPEGAKPCMAYDNGGFVKCYCHTEGDVLRIYRPNPNDAAVYQPLTIAEELRYIGKYGTIGSHIFQTERE